MFAKVILKSNRHLFMAHGVNLIAYSVGCLRRLCLSHSNGRLIQHIMAILLTLMEKSFCPVSSFVSATRSLVSLLLFWQVRTYVSDIMYYFSRSSSILRRGLFCFAE